MDPTGTEMGFWTKFAWHKKVGIFGLLDLGTKDDPAFSLASCQSKASKIPN